MKAAPPEQGTIVDTIQQEVRQHYRMRLADGTLLVC
jgi:hypothetical protein